MKWLIIAQDLGVKEDCVRIVKTAVEVLGGLDIVISNAVSNATTLTHAAQD